jgi:hypothetical protein
MWLMILVNWSAPPMSHFMQPRPVVEISSACRPPDDTSHVGGPAALLRAGGHISYRRAGGPHFLLARTGPKRFIGARGARDAFVLPIGPRMRRVRRRSCRRSARSQHPKPSLVRTEICRVGA